MSPTTKAQSSPIVDHPDIPEMSVSADNTVYTSSDKVGIIWRLIPIEIKVNEVLKDPPPKTFPKDPRLQPRPQLSSLINLNTVPVQVTHPPDEPVSQPQPRKRVKLALNEDANPLLTGGRTKPSNTPEAYANILDPRLIKRQVPKPTETSCTTTTNTNSTKNNDDDDSLTPKPLKVVLSPTQHQERSEENSANTH